MSEEDRVRGAGLPSVAVIAGPPEYNDISVGDILQRERRLEWLAGEGRAKRRSRERRRKGGKV